MFQPAAYSESEAIVGYLDEQLDALRNAAFGLTEEQARATPCRSALSIGGLLKHAIYIFDNVAAAEGAAESAHSTHDDAAVQRFMASFALGADETLESTLAAFDAGWAAYLRSMRGNDPAAEVLSPPAPWFGIHEPIPVTKRFQMLHHIEEFARHAGHADIIREQLDGASAPSLWMAATGQPGNAFVKPWTPPAAD